MHASEIHGPIVLAGATGDLGGRIAVALGRRSVPFRVLLRAETSPSVRATLESLGATAVVVDYADGASLRRGCDGAACVVCALNGLENVMIGMQGALLDAAVSVGVPRFIPSDYSLDFTKTRPGDNRNMDLRRTFMQRVDARTIRATSVLNGAFADLLTGQAPIVLHKQRKIVYWGSADRPLDFTAKDDVAAYVVDVALDEAAPRLLRVAGSVTTPRELAAIMTQLTGTPFGLLRPGGIGLLGALIALTRTLTPKSDDVFPAWQGMQYLRDMASGRGKLAPLDNDRYGARTWTSARDVLAQALAASEAAV